MASSRTTSHAQRTVPRAYIRHPADMPIEIRTSSNQPDAERLKDISHGGLAFQSHTPWQVGDLVCITIPVTQPAFETCAQVMWCVRTANRDSFEVGVQFMASDDAYAARMVEQVCHIEHYRREVLAKEGREMDVESAAQEWINRFAGDFPSLPFVH